MVSISSYLTGVCMQYAYMYFARAHPHAHIIRAYTRIRYKVMFRDGLRGDWDDQRAGA